MSRVALWHLATILSLSFLAMGCGGEEGVIRPSTRGTTTAEKTNLDAIAEAERTSANTEEGASWSSSGGESGGNERAAGRILGVEFEAHGGYERVLIEFGSGGRKGAGLPRWSLERPAEGGYVRLLLPGVTSTQTAGEDLVGLATDAYYVVHDAKEGLFVDIVALGAFQYRTVEIAETGQLAVDFRRAPGGLTCPVVQDDNTVVTQPCEAEEVAAGEPLAVEGYAREPGGSLTLVLLNEEGAPIATGPLRTNDGNEAWGHFESSVTVPPSYEGFATLQVVGDQGRDDEASERTEVPVFIGVGQDEQLG